MQGASSDFSIDIDQLLKNDRIHFGSWVVDDLSVLSESIALLAERSSIRPIQRGRVIALRWTDTDRLFSSFKSALYHGNYSDMLNKERFIKNIVPRRHSYEPIRGETVLFLFVGVSKTIYDALSMFVSGRPTRITGGFRHSIPWGIEVPLSSSHTEEFFESTLEPVEAVAKLMKTASLNASQEAELDMMRHQLPVSYIMAPFVLEFSVEALVTKVFQQRLWEEGADSRESFDVVHDMWRCCLEIDRELFEELKRYQMVAEADYASGFHKDVSA